MVRTIFRGVQGGVRCGGQSIGQGGARGDGGIARTVGQRSDRGVRRESGQISSQCSSQVGDLHVRRPMSIGSSQDADRGAGLGIGLHSNQGSGRSDDRGVRLGGMQAGDRGVQRFTDLLQSDGYPDTFEGVDDDDNNESTFHVTQKRRGQASQVQVPEPMNRDWIQIVGGQFSNQPEATRIIGVILKGMWNGPWDSWRDVPTEDRVRLFERFQCYYQWKEEWHVQIHTYWEKCISNKFPGLLMRVRNEAKEKARKQGLEVEDDLTVLENFKPSWIRTEIWEQMIKLWDTNTWKAKSGKNKNIRMNSAAGKHTLGSQSFVTLKRKAFALLGRELTPQEVWKQAHCRKGSRPLDKDTSSTSSLALEVDSENLDVENLDWVNEWSRDTLVKYKKSLAEKYGKKPPAFDVELWSEAEGRKKKGKLYGLGTDPYIDGRQDPEENEKEIERLNGVIKELLVEKEKEKKEKDAMESRLTNIEDILRNISRI